MQQPERALGDWRERPDRRQLSEEEVAGPDHEQQGEENLVEKLHFKLH